MRLILFCLSIAACSLACAGLSSPFATPTPAVTLVLAPADPEAAAPDSLEAAQAVLQRRYDESLNGRANVIVDGSNLRVELFGNSDTALASQLATEIGALEFFDSASPLLAGAPVHAGAAPVLTDADVSSVLLKVSETTGAYMIQLSLTDEGKARLADYTRANVGRYLVIARDGVVLSSPKISSPITAGEAVIQGDFDQESANMLAIQLRSGRLPLALVVSEVK